MGLRWQNVDMLTGLIAITCAKNGRRGFANGARRLAVQSIRRCELN